MLAAAEPSTTPAKTRASLLAAGRDTSNKLRTAEAGGIPLLVTMMAGCGVNDSDASRQAAASALRWAAWVVVALLVVAHKMCMPCVRLAA